jgi:hypothetical protein
MPNLKNPAWYGGGLVSSMWPGAGNVFYVNGISGSNANNGLTPTTPKLTMTAALALCTNDADDYIVVLDYWQPAGETWPINVNKSKVHILGIRSGTLTRPWVCAKPPADTAVFSISANDVRIADWYLEAGASHGAIEFTGGVSRIGIYNCWFGSGANGILDGPAGIGFSVEIANCFFCQALTAQAIYINDDPAFITIHDNVFDQSQGVAIEVVQGAAAVITGNLIACGADVTGRGITLGASVTRAIVMNNSANFGDADMVNNPFSDAAAADTNHWANNVKGITLIHPA